MLKDGTAAAPAWSVRIHFASAWVAAFSVRPPFSIPVVHLVAGSTAMRPAGSRTLVRSVACVGLGRAETALDDVSKALELDPRNPRARAFAWSIAEVAEGRAHPLLQEMSHLAGQRDRAAELVRRYAIERPD